MSEEIIPSKWSEGKPKFITVYSKVRVNNHEKLVILKSSNHCHEKNKTKTRTSLSLLRKTYGSVPQKKKKKIGVFSAFTGMWNGL